MSPFKDSMGRWRTKSLFVEECDSATLIPMYTLAEEDREVSGLTYISLKRKYLEYMDVHEHLFAEKMFGSYQCWLNLCESPFFKPHIEMWREELNQKLLSIGMKHMMYRAEMGDTAAARWLAEGKFKEGKSRGRPSNKLKLVPKDDGITSIAARMGM